MANIQSVSTGGFEAWLQMRLTAHGFPVGPITGLLTPTTLAALQAFQKRKCLPLTAKADTATVAALKTSASLLPDGLSRPVGQAPEKPATQHAPWPTQSQVPKFFGVVGVNQVQVTLPYSMILAWDKKITIGRITLHEKVAASALRALNAIGKAYDADQRRALGLDIFGGALNVRKMRGGDRYSMHSWGIALDFDPERNGLHTESPQARLSHADCAPFWQAWEQEGWVSLGRDRNFDWMHVQAARL